MDSHIILGLIILVVLFFVFKISKKIILTFFVILTILFAIFAISGCSGSSIGSYSGIAELEENTMSRIDDIPFPKNTSLDINNSLIMGEGSNWSGQLIMNVPEDKIKVFNFYIRNLIDYGWKEQTTIRGKVSVLNYLGPNKRVAIITIAKGSFGSSDVLVSVSPFTQDFDKAFGDQIKETFLDIDE